MLSHLRRASFHSITLANASRCVLLARSPLHPSLGSVKAVSNGLCWTVLSQVADAYLACLKVHDKNAGECKVLAKRYLECRMERCVRLLPAGCRLSPLLWGCPWLAAAGSRQQQQQVQQSRSNSSCFRSQPGVQQHGVPGAT